jgi:hypothetical protein
MRRSVVLGAAVLTVGVLAGCTTATSGIGSGPAPGPATVTVTASPTQALWTIPEAQQHYLEFIYQGNDDYTYLDSLPCTCTGDVPLSSLTGVCQRIVVDNNLTADDFAGGSWPTIAVPTITALTAAIKAENTGYTQCADATSLAAASAGLRKVVPITPEALAARTVLGLPTTANPTSTATPTQPSDI